MSSRNVLVLGGTGFVGKAIIKQALNRRWRVVSLSRRGDPPMIEHIYPIVHVQGNALDESVYEPIIKKYNIDCIIHAIGVIKEGTAKIENPKLDDLRSFEVVNRDTALVAAKAAAKSHQIRDFGYVSAADLGIITRKFFLRYQEAKYEAERALLKYTEFRTVIIRPGFMYGTDRWMTVPLSWPYRIISPFSFRLLPKALPVDIVAHKFLNALSAEGRSRILEIHDLF
jgi:nucleoside-diphosphate-sugar epimerase